MKKIGIKQEIEEEQFLALNPKTQELAFNMLYCEQVKLHDDTGLFFHGLAIDDLEMNTVNATYMNGNNFEHTIYLSRVCQKITIGALIEALSCFGDLRIFKNKVYDDDYKNERCKCDLNYDYYSEAVEFEASSYEVIDALLQLLDSACIKKIQNQEGVLYGRTKSEVD